MELKSRVALVLAAIAFPPLAPALAADYDPPIYVDQAPEYTPVEIGSGWYLRGDVGYAFSHPFKDQTFATDPLDPTQTFSHDSSLLTGTVGMGYHFNDYFRGELNFGILPTEKFGDHHMVPDGCAGSTNTAIVGPGGTVIIQPVAATEDCEATNGATNKGYSIMANAYVDLGTYVGITPYIGGGLGLAYTKYTKSMGARDCVSIPTNSSGTGGFACDNPAGYGGTVDSDAKFNLAYSLGAGLSYQISKNVSVDLGYEYFSVPGAEYVAYDDGAFNVHKGEDYQTVKVGFRYDLW